MTITTEPARRHGPSRAEAGAAPPVSIEREHDIVRLGRRFVEHARIDQWRANILIQLAESVGDRIDSLSGYIDMLLAQPDGVPANEPAHAGWFTELGLLESSL